MIQSMTAFSRTQLQSHWGTLVCECRSINHRYLEMGLRIPDTFQELESEIRDRVRQHIKRGKVECLIRFQAQEGVSADITINHEYAQQLCLASERIASIMKNPAAINAMDILKWPGVMQVASIDLEVIKEDVLKLVEKTLVDLVQARCREGQQLKQLFLQRLESMSQEVAKVQLKLPNIAAQQREKLIARFHDASLSLDNARLEQELVIYAQKIDVSEELDRLTSHIHEVKRVLQEGGAMGRRLDFLMQELNREANTLGSKSVDAETTRASVELKVLIEQIREQVQNVE